MQEMWHTVLELCGGELRDISLASKPSYRADIMELRPKETEGGPQAPEQAEGEGGEQQTR